MGAGRAAAEGDQAMLAVAFAAAEDGSSFSA